MGWTDFQHIALWCLWIMDVAKKKEAEEVNRCWSNETYEMLKRKMSTVIVTLSASVCSFFNRTIIETSFIFPWQKLICESRNNGRNIAFSTFQTGQHKVPESLTNFFSGTVGSLWYIVLYGAHSFSHPSFYRFLLADNFFRLFRIKRGTSESRDWLLLLVCAFTTSLIKLNLPQRVAFPAG